MWVLFFFACVVLGHGQELDVNATRKWMLAVEELLSAVSLGPLKKEFTPSYLGRRTHASVLATQTARFRARTARSLIEADGTRVIVCIDATTTTDAAVDVVLQELKEREFNAFVVKAHSSCPLIGGKKLQDALLIDDLPAPVAGEAPAPAAAAAAE